MSWRIESGHQRPPVLLISIELAKQISRKRRHKPNRIQREERLGHLANVRYAAERKATRLLFILVKLRKRETAIENYDTFWSTHFTELTPHVKSGSERVHSGWRKLKSMKSNDAHMPHWLHRPSVDTHSKY